QIGAIMAGCQTSAERAKVLSGLLSHYAATEDHITRQILLQKLSSCVLAHNAEQARQVATHFQEALWMALSAKPHLLYLFLLKDEAAKAPLVQKAKDYYLAMLASDKLGHVYNYSDQHLELQFRHLGDTVEVTNWLELARGVNHTSSLR